MKLIVGFGNPETKYNFTRHNFGFLALDFYAKLKGLSWEKTPKFDAIWLKKGNTVFIKPQTYYNEVGKSIQAFAHFYKIQSSDILVICDDFDLDFGKTRLRAHGSSGGNNGLKSTERELGTSDFNRLRLGTDSKLRAKSGGKIEDIDFVLGKFTPEEKEQLPEILRESASLIDDFID
ncbi:aminoacyl-tRNA hydrolase [Candidatus Saccharibacteria bacterium]|nr:aminoacyl-tRNA hydrolase [Candidatus Saccharibacteria bacterium]